MAVTRIDHELNIVLANLSRQVKRIKGRTPGGLLAAGHIILKRSKQLTPVATEHLRGFTDVVSHGSGNNAGVTISYNASYAIFVHEVEGAYHKPPTQWKFLETAIIEKRGDALEAIRKRVKI